MIEIRLKLWCKFYCARVFQYVLLTMTISRCFESQHKRGDEVVGNWFFRLFNWQLLLQHRDKPISLCLIMYCFVSAGIHAVKSKQYYMAVKQSAIGSNMFSSMYSGSID